MWSENEREILKEMKRTCLIHMFLQSGSAHVNYIIHNALSLPNIALGAVTSISIFSTSQPGWRIASGVMAVCGTILAGLSRQLAPGEKAQLHASVTKQYQSIIQDINANLLLESDEDERRRYIDHIKSEIDRLLSLQPDASMLVIREFEKKYHKHVEKALYPEFAHMEMEMIRNANRITTRVSATHRNPVRVRSAYHMTSTSSGFRAASGSEWNAAYVVDVPPLQTVAVAR